MKYLLLIFPLLLPPSVNAEDGLALPKSIGGVVKSDDWIIRRAKGEEEFSGNVSYKNPEYDLKCDWALYKQLDGILEAKGHVVGKKFWKEGGYTETRSDYAKYLKPSGFATLLPSEKTGIVTIIHEDPKEGKWTATANAAYAEEKKALLTLEGNARIKSAESEATGNKVLYKRAENRIELYGNTRMDHTGSEKPGSPPAHVTTRSDIAIYRQADKAAELYGGRPAAWGNREQYDFAVNADTITITNAYNDMLAEGRAKGWLRDKKNGTQMR